jgi:hypothetical protein
VGAGRDPFVRSGREDNLYKLLVACSAAAHVHLPVEGVFEVLTKSGIREFCARWSHTGGQGGRACLTLDLPSLPAPLSSDVE